MRVMIFFFLWIKLGKWKLKSIIKDCNCIKSAGWGLLFAGQFGCPSLQLDTRRGDPVAESCCPACRVRAGAGVPAHAAVVSPNRQTSQRTLTENPCSLRLHWAFFPLLLNADPGDPWGHRVEEGLRGCSLMVPLHHLTWDTSFSPHWWSFPSCTLIKPFNWDLNCSEL